MGIDLRKRIGREINHLRIAKGMVQQVLADRAGLSRRMLSKIENGHVEPSITVLLALLHVLGVSASAFFKLIE
jgi:transcriptional regulator with XRE-family HTH domain